VPVGATPPSTTSTGGRPCPLPAPEVRPSRLV
jgi:hypothetical protein